MENNIFESVIDEVPVSVDSKTVLVIQLFLLVTPITESDSKENGLNK